MQKEMSNELIPANIFQGIYADLKTYCPIFSKMLNSRQCKPLSKQIDGNFGKGLIS